MSEVNPIEAAIERELSVLEMLMTDPLTLRRLQAKRIARAALTALAENITPEMVEAGQAIDGTITAEQVFRAMCAAAMKGKG